MLGKYYIFQCRQKQTSPFFFSLFYSFLLLVKDGLLLDNYIYITKGKQQTFENRFGEILRLI